jgi:integrase
MEWVEVDLDSDVWEIPGRRTKNGRPHAVPLATAAKAILKRRCRDLAETEPRVFPALTLRSDDYRELAAIHGGAYEWTDLRRTVATRLASLGFDETTIGRVLNHARYTVTAKHYNKHAYLAEKRTALESWDRELHRIIKQKPARKS